MTLTFIVFWIQMKWEGNSDRIELLPSWDGSSKKHWEHERFIKSHYVVADIIINLFSLVRSSFLKNCLKQIFRVKGYAPNVDFNHYLLTSAKNLKLQSKPEKANIQKKFLACKKNLLTSFIIKTNVACGRHLLSWSCCLKVEDLYSLAAAEWSVTKSWAALFFAAALSAAASPCVHSPEKWIHFDLIWLTLLHVTEKVECELFRVFTTFYSKSFPIIAS